MNGAHAALGAAFVALGCVFLTRARNPDGDETKARNSKLAGNLMLFAGAAFLIAAAIPIFTAY